jgi:transcriptional regulator with XRE-family HTH domain
MKEKRKIILNLKELRLRKQFSQIEMAFELGVALVSYTLWERKVGFPNKENFKKIKDYFGKDVEVKSI